MRRGKPLNDEVGAAVGALVLHHQMVLLHTPTVAHIVARYTNWTLSYVPSHISYVQSAATIACNLVCHIFLHAAILNVFLLYTTSCPVI